MKRILIIIVFALIVASIAGIAKYKQMEKYKQECVGQEGKGWSLMTVMYGMEFPLNFGSCEEMKRIQYEDRQGYAVPDEEMIKIMSDINNKPDWERKR